MKWYVKVYFVLGVLALLAAYVVLLNIFINSTIAGIHGGLYAVPIYTNNYGENIYEVAFLAFTFPAVAFIFVKLLRPLFSSKEDRGSKPQP